MAYQVFDSDTKVQDAKAPPPPPPQNIIQPYRTESTNVTSFRPNPPPAPVVTQKSEFDDARENAEEIYRRALEAAGRRYTPGSIGQVDLSGADTQVGRQNINLDALRLAADGKGPSAAAALGASHLAQAGTQARSQAAGFRGAGRGAGQMQALMMFGQQAPAIAAGAAALRAQEQQAAMSAYTTAINNARALDQDAALRGADLRLRRDMGAEGLNQAGFDLNTDALLGALGMGNQAIGNQLTGAAGAVDDMQFGENLALQREQLKAQKRAAWLNFFGGILGAGGDAAAAYYTGGMKK